MRLLIFTACLWHATFAAPQFVTFKDGKIGVNFGGYHADAGLGGLLTGNAAHGGLSASAGTPWGPQAAAGLGGRLNGRTSGIAYAGAEANPSVGASALLGGSAGEYGIAGSEAHANGKVSSKTISSLNAHHQAPAVEVAAAAPVTSGPLADNGIQKIKPPKKYTLLKNERLSNAYKNRNNETAKTKATAISVATVAFESGTNEAAATIAASHAASVEKSKEPNHQKDNANNNASNAAGDAGNDTHAGAGDDDASSLIIVNRQRQRQRQLHRQRKHQVQRLRQTRPKSQQQTQQQIQIAPSANEHTRNTYDNAAHSKHLVKTVYRSPPPPPPPPAFTPYGGSESGGAEVHANSGIIGSALQIPIGILRSLQESLGGLGVDKSVSYQKNY